MTMGMIGLMVPGSGKWRGVPDIVDPTDSDALAGIQANPDRERAEQRGRAVVLGVLAVFVIAGLAGVFGVRTTTVNSSDDDLDLRVTYPKVTRAGLAVALAVRVEREGGFTEPVTISVDTSYLQLFDQNGIMPAAASETVDEDRTSWTFDPPPGEVLTLWLDVRAEPAVQWGRRASVTASNAGDRTSVRIRTWIAP